MGIVNHNTADLLVDCLASLADEPDVEIVVVDSGSSDDSVARVRDAFPGIEVIEAPNRGYGAGANLALERSTKPVAVLLNADVRVRPGAIGALQAHLRAEPSCAIAGPRIVGVDGEDQSCGHDDPTPLSMLLQDLGRADDVTGHATVTPVDWVLGAAIAIRREAWETLGGFDESFRMYFEESDLCRRARAAGWDVQVVPAAVVEHVGGASTSARRWEMQRLYHHSRARWFRRHAARWQLMALAVGTIAAMVARMVRDAPAAILGREEPRQATRTWANIAADAARLWPDAT